MPNEDDTLTPEETAQLVTASTLLGEAGIALVAAQRATQASVLADAVSLLDGTGRAIATLGKYIDFVLGDDAPDHSEQTERLLAIIRG